MITNSNHKLQQPVDDSLWDATDSILLKKLAENPTDIILIKEINSRLSGPQSSDALIKGFLASKGVETLVQALTNILKQENITEFDVAVLYEVLLCCKSVMNSSAGMDGFIAVADSIETIVNCLQFDFKYLSLLILEILSVRGELNQETPFACLCAALIDVDVETKTAIMKFVNTMLVELEDSDDAYQEMLSHLREEDFEGSYQDALNVLDSACDELANDMASEQASPTPGLSPGPGILSNPSGSSKRNKNGEPRYLTLSLPYLDEGDEGDGEDGERDVSFDRVFERNHASVRIFQTEHSPLSPIPPLRKQNTFSLLDVYKSRAKSTRLVGGSGLGAFSEEDEEACSAEGRPGSFTVDFPVGLKYTKRAVSPDDGSMAGPLIVEKNSSKRILFGQKTKQRWFYLDGRTLKNLHFSDHTSEGSLEVATFLRVKSKTSAAAVANESKYQFELETVDGHVHAFGCNDMTVCQQWVTAINAAKARFLLSLSSYQKRVTDSNRLSINDVVAFAEQFKKQGALYISITTENRQASIKEHGFNFKDVNEVSQYLQNLLLAAGFHKNLLEILHELVLMAPGDAGIWDGIRNGLRRMRKQARVGSRGASFEMESSMSDEGFETDDTSTYFSSQHRSKINETGSLYAEVSRLAMIAVTKEQENRDLLDRIRKMEEQYSVARVSSSLSRKKTPSIEEAVEQLKTARMQSKIKELEEFFASDQIKIQKLMDKCRQLEDDMEDLRNKHGSEIQELNTQWERKLADARATASTSNVTAAESETTGRMSKYASMLKVLQEVQVRQKMRLDGISDEDAEAFFQARLKATTQPAVVTDGLDTYRKMKKNKLPDGAIRQKMAKDGLSEQEIEDIMNSNKLSSPATASPPQAQPDLTSSLPPVPPPAPSPMEKYEKMRKMFPEAVLRHKMTADGLSAEAIEDFFKPQEQPPPSQPAAASGKFDKYDKMKKLFPEAVLRHKMAADGLTADEIESFFQPGSSAVPHVAASANGSVDVSKFEKYKKMKTILPDNVVRHKMLAEGCTATEIDAFFAQSQGAPKRPNPGDMPPEGMQEKVATVKPPHKLKPFFWEKLKPADVPSTLFYKLPDFEIPSFFLSALDDLYVAKGAASKSGPKDKEKDGEGGESGSTPSSSSSSGQVAGTSSKQAASPAKAKALQSVVDSKRVQTLLIVMSKLKMDPEQVMRVVCELDPAVLSHEVTLSVLSILPTSEEIGKVRAFSDPELLDRASRLFFHLARIPHLATRLELHELAFTWFGGCSGLSTQVRIVIAACEELSAFEPHMRQVLAIVLALGNYLNTDTKFGSAYGFKVDAVMKLDMAKDAKSGNLLNCLASLVEQYASEALTESSKWTAISAAAGISFQQILQEMDTLEEQVGRMRKELAKIGDGPTNRGLDGVLESREDGYVTYPYFNRLTSFLLAAEPNLSEVKDKVRVAQEMVAALMKKYGETFDATAKDEEGGGSSAKSKEEEAIKFKFFHIIGTFFRKLRIACDENVKRRKAAEKAAAVGQESEKTKKSSSSKAKNPNPNPSPMGGDITIPKLKLLKGAGSSKSANGSTSAETKGVTDNVIALTSLQKAKSKRLGLGTSSAPPKRNLFSTFHSEHESTTEAVVTEFIKQPSKRGIMSLIQDSLASD